MTIAEKISGRLKRLIKKSSSTRQLTSAQKSAAFTLPTLVSESSSPIDSSECIAIILLNSNAPGQACVEQYLLCNDRQQLHHILDHTNGTTLLQQMPSQIACTANNTLNDLLPSLAEQADHILLLSKGCYLTGDGLLAMYTALQQDPMLSATCPRELDNNLLQVYQQPKRFKQYKRAAPTTMIRAFHPSHSSLLLKSHVVLDFFNRQHAPHESLAIFFAVINRKGFNIGICNHVLAPITQPLLAYTSLPGNEFSAIKQYDANLNKHYEEQAIARLHTINDASQKILIDITGLGTHYNGTSKLTFAFLDELNKKANRDAYAYTLLATNDSIHAFALRSKYPELEIVTDIEARYFKIAIRTSQPWSISDCKRLAHHAYFNYFIMYDTIAYDCLYVRSPHVTRAWQYVANHSDGIISISEFTRDHFKRRFTCYSSTPPQHCVARPSLRASDYVKSPHQTASTPQQVHNILVVGNQHTHKNVDEVARTLPPLFPQLAFTFLGIEGESALSNIRYTASGQLDDATIEQMYQWADIVIYPSSFEGFGYPLFHSLSYDKCVFVRQSPLNDECLALYKGPGRVISFNTFMQLNQRLQRYIARVNDQKPPLGEEQTFGCGESDHHAGSMFHIVSQFTQQFSQQPNPKKVHLRHIVLSEDG